MHSSRMRTGRTLTILGGGIGASQKDFFWEKKLKKKKKHFWRPPKNLETPPKFGETPQNLEEPPQNLENPPPKFGGTPPGPDPPLKILRNHPLWTEFLTHASENITLTQLHCGR